MLLQQLLLMSVQGSDGARHLLADSHYSPVRVRLGPSGGTAGYWIEQGNGSHGVWAVFLVLLLIL